MSDELEKAKQNMIKKILENKTEALLAKKYYTKLEELLKTKKMLSINEVSSLLNLKKMDVRMIFEDLILYNVVSGKIKGETLIID